MTVKSITCPNCNAVIRDLDPDTGSGKCPYCGSLVYDPDFPGADKRVVEVHLVDETAPAGNVASPVAEPRVLVSPKNKQTALLLCIFLGFFGVHRFYVGKIGTGIIWLFTAGACGIGWIVDIVMIAANGFTDSSGLKITEASGGRNYCSKCGSVVSIGRTKCPACGTFKRKWWQTWWGVFLCIAVILIALRLISLATGGGRS